MSSTTEYAELMEFEDAHVKIPKKLLKGIFGYGWEKPSAIQQKAIPPMVAGRDLIAQAQSGTGKTGSFSIGSLYHLEPNLKSLQIIIMAHTRELAIQIKEVIDALSTYMNIKTCLCIGGTNISENKTTLENAQVIIGTPGRINDMKDRKYFSTQYVKVLVLDEADRMLSTGFQEQVKSTINSIPSKTQICIFSATLNDDVIQLTKHFMTDPVKILVAKDMLTLDGIKQFYIGLDKDSWKFDVLVDIYGKLNVTQSIVYVNTKEKADWLSKQLQNSDFTVACIHSDMSLADRTNVMKEFKSGVSRVLISTDLLARGIDIQQVSIVINYDMPTNKAQYIHRIGRSGRFGRKGLAINFVTNKDRDLNMLKEIETYYATQIDDMPEDIEKYIPM